MTPLGGGTSKSRYSVTWDSSESVLMGEITGNGGGAEVQILLRNRFFFSYSGEPMEPLSERFQKLHTSVFAGMYDLFAQELGVDPKAIEELGVGFDYLRQAWVFAERNALGNIIGLSYRYENGKKTMCPGYKQKRGLVYPFNQEYDKGVKRYAPGRHNWSRVADVGVNCPVCGKFIPTSKPIHCSPECVHIAMSEGDRRAMTPERIAHFNSIRRRPTPEQQSKAARAFWEKVKSWPTEKQKEYYMRRAEPRKVRILKQCVICGETFDVIPSHASQAVTCGRDTCKRENSRRNALGRKHTPESIARMSEHAKRRHAIEGGRFGKNKAIVHDSMQLVRGIDL